MNAVAAASTGQVSPARRSTPLGTQPSRPKKCGAARVSSHDCSPPRARRRGPIIATRDSCPQKSRLPSCHERWTRQKRRRVARETARAHDAAGVAANPRRWRGARPPPRPRGTSRHISSWLAVTRPRDVRDESYGVDAFRLLRVAVPQRSGITRATAMSPTAPLPPCLSASCCSPPSFGHQREGRRQGTGGGDSSNRHCRDPLPKARAVGSRHRVRVDALSHPRESGFGIGVNVCRIAGLRRYCNAAHGAAPDGVDGWRRGRTIYAASRRLLV